MNVGDVTRGQQRDGSGRRTPTMERRQPGGLEERKTREEIEGSGFEKASERTSGRKMQRVGGVAWKGDDWLQ